MEKLADTVEMTELPMFEELLVTDDMPQADEMLLVEEPAIPEDKSFDWEKNKDFKKFLEHLKGKVGKIPPHSGKTTAGCERAIMYLKLCDKEISKAVGEDLDCHIDDQEVETMRKQIRKMIKQLQKRHDEINEAYDADDAKYASIKNNGFTKDAAQGSSYKIKPVGHVSLISVHFDDLAKALKAAKDISMECEKVDVFERGSETLLAAALRGKVELTPDGMSKLGLGGNEKPDKDKPDVFFDRDLSGTDVEPAYADDKKEAILHCNKCGMKVADKHAAAIHAATAHKGEDITFSDLEVTNKKTHACVCEVVKNAAPEDGNCPTCKIKLWATDEGVMECIACEEVFDGQIKKEAGTPKVQLIMTPFERAICGIITNGVVSQGRNAEETYAELKKEYKFNNRDELSIQQLLTDLGYPVARNFMASPHSNVEFATNYNA